MKENPGAVYSRDCASVVIISRIVICLVLDYTPYIFVCMHMYVLINGKFIDKLVHARKSMSLYIHMCLLYKLNFS